MNTSIIIRKAAISDAEKINQFNCAMALETENKVLVKSVSLSGVKAVLNDPNKGFYLVAEYQNQTPVSSSQKPATKKIIVGSLLITHEWSDWKNKNYWWIQSVFVDIKFRNTGIFKKFYKCICELAKINGMVCGIRLYVEKENNIAMKAYKRCNMKQSHYLLYEMKILS